MDYYLKSFLQGLYTRIGICIGLIIICLSQSISGEEKKEFSYYIEWKNIAGAKGYLIQVKDKATGTEKEEKLDQSNIELKIVAGKYEYRIASINKFGKPSVWTNWEEFYVEKDKPKPKDSKQAEVKPVEDNQTKPVEIKKWKWFIPGLTQFQTGERISGSLWILWFTALAAYGNSERVAGNQVASNRMNDPMFLSTLALGTPVSVDLYLREKRNEAKAEYEKHQSNQKAAGVVAILSYALQVWHARRVSQSSNVSFELNSRSQGLSELKSIQADNPYLSFEFAISMRY
ncbi:MAG: fibronectin type III domain-containing protein [Leptospiraceae bacterium]|nr:fibronectin type III domain-containing protein [Leptospiraceae bacterium]